MGDLGRDVVEIEAQSRGYGPQRVAATAALAALDLGEVGSGEIGLPRELGDGQAAMLTPDADGAFTRDHPFGQFERDGLFIASLDLVVSADVRDHLKLVEHCFVGLDREHRELACSPLPDELDLLARCVGSALDGHRYAPPLGATVTTVSVLP